MAAFEALTLLVRRHGEVLTWRVIEQGFQSGSASFLFANQTKGIFRPAGMCDAALSLKTTVPRSGSPPYDDLQTDEAFVYAFQRRGPEYHDNRLLLRAIELRCPLISFVGVEPGLYRPLWPVYAAQGPTEDRSLLTLDPGLALPPGAHVADPLMQSVARRYATVEAKKRLHQDLFRGAVLRAYALRCAVCRLPRRELLDAAHILPDNNPRGDPLVTNGLALCKLHHAAYDSNLIGIRADHIVEIAPQLMAETDGPTLEHGLKNFDGSAIHTPTRVELRPNREFLAERYALFRQTA